VEETSAGEPLISTRPLGVTKWSVWLVSKENRVYQAPNLVIQNLLQYCTTPPSPTCRLLTNQHTKTLQLQNPLFTALWEV